jgi:hypothetical protein
MTRYSNNLHQACLIMYGALYLQSAVSKFNLCLSCPGCFLAKSRITSGVLNAWLMAAQLRQRLSEVKWNIYNVYHIHVRYCHQLASIIVHKLVHFCLISLKPLDQLQLNLYLEFTFQTKWPYKTGDLLKEV